MEDLITGIVWFGNTVVICIVAIVIYCMVKGSKQYGIYNEVRINVAIHWFVCHWVDWIGDIGQFVRMFDVVE